MGERGEKPVKLTPFLTVKISKNGAGIKVSCPELGMGFNLSPCLHEEAIAGMQKVVAFDARFILDREVFNSPRRKIAQKIVSELEKGVEIADLFKTSE